MAGATTKPGVGDEHYTGRLTWRVIVACVIGASEWLSGLALRSKAGEGGDGCDEDETCKKARAPRPCALIGAPCY